MRAKTRNDRRVGRRNLVAGVLFGVIVATVAGAWATTVFTKMVKGKSATAASVNLAHQDLATAIDNLGKKVTAQAAEIAKLKTDRDCPPGYTKDTTAPSSITVCKKGKDEMVKVGSYWVDRYEASLVDAKTWSSGQCNGTGTQYGASSDNYPSMFQDSGNWATKVYACSVAGRIPSRMMTWFQAQQACLLSGKTLCTNGQWQGAAAGTYDPGKYNGAAGGSCHTGGSAPRKTGMAGKVPGASASCISRWGAEDMIGNLFEWVDWWDQAGKTWMTSDGQDASPWPSTGGYGDGGDKTWNLDGRVLNPSWINGSPAAALRGGGWYTGTDAGVFAVNLNEGPSSWHTDHGARCCRQ